MDIVSRYVAPDEVFPVTTINKYQQFIQDRWAEKARDFGVAFYWELLDFASGREELIKLLKEIKNELSEDQTQTNK